MTRIGRRGALALLVGGMPVAASAGEPDPWQGLRVGGHVVLFRHALAPGTGDPPQFRLGDCSTQRNLDERGREQARAIGSAFRSRGIRVDRVLSSAWCRCLETAELLNVGDVEVWEPLNSFFGDREKGPAQVARIEEFLRVWRGPGNALLVTHQVNVTGATGVYPRSGEGVVVRPLGDGFKVVGRLPAP